VARHVVVPKTLSETRAPQIKTVTLPRGVSCAKLSGGWRLEKSYRRSGFRAQIATVGHAKLQDQRTRGDLWYPQRLNIVCMAAGVWCWRKAAASDGHGTPRAWGSKGFSKPCRPSSPKTCPSRSIEAKSQVSPAHTILEPVCFADLSHRLAPAIDGYTWLHKVRPHFIPVRQAPR
jgi:hypothetical protein